MSEFDLIERYFTWDSVPNNVAIAVGDDAAVLDVPSNKQIVTSIDTLISGVHFPENTSANAIGHKALAVNLSDLAAMGATPAWFTLALTLPKIETEWLEGFSSGLKSMAKQHGIYLVGGDTTCGSLSISIQVIGLVDKGHALLRRGAQVGDRIYVTGTLGDAAAGLQLVQGNLELSTDDDSFCKQRLNYPQPRLPESSIIREFASSCIDVSDGLLQDLSHILKASNVGAQINLAQLPFSTALQQMEKTQALQFALSGGDDYELLFTIPEVKEEKFLQRMKDEKYKVSCIGSINNQKKVITGEKNQLLKSKGYNHFDE